jgi:hypothetical protein
MPSDRPCLRTAEIGPRLPIEPGAFDDAIGGFADSSQDVLGLAAVERQAAAPAGGLYRLGVLEGNAGDRRAGLPWQSVHDGTRFIHEPIRLIVFIADFEAAMDAVLVKHAGVRGLVANGWVHWHGPAEWQKVRACRPSSGITTAVFGLPSLPCTARKALSHIPFAIGSTPEMPWTEIHASKSLGHTMRRFERSDCVRAEARWCQHCNP